MFTNFPLCRPVVMFSRECWHQPCVNHYKCVQEREHEVRVCQERQSNEGQCAAPTTHAIPHTPFMSRSLNESHRFPFRRGASPPSSPPVSPLAGARQDRTAATSNSGRDSTRLQLVINMHGARCPSEPGCPPFGSSCYSSRDLRVLVACVAALFKLPCVSACDGDAS